MALNFISRLETIEFSRNLNETATNLRLDLDHFSIFAIQLKPFYHNTLTVLKFMK